MHDKPLISLVLLQSAPRELNEQDLCARFSHALSRSFGNDPHVGDAVKQMKPGMFMLRVGERGFGLMSLAQPYWDILPPDIEQLEARTRVAVKNHKAWLAIDLLERSVPGGVASVDEEHRAYRTIGKLLAALAGDEALALLNLKTRRCMYWHDASADRLRSEEPFSAFDPYTPIIYTQSSDSELEAAVEEARRRWPEFERAYAVRAPKQAFAVKASFSEGKYTEFMWVEVTSIEGATIRGLLRNQPNNFRLLKLDDPVELQQSDVLDWVYESDRAFCGGFMTKVLERRAHGNNG